MYQIKLPFSKDPADPFFVKAKKALPRVGLLSEDDVYAIWRHACRHMAEAVKRCGNFSKQLTKKDKIDISHGKTIYVLLQERLGKDIQSRLRQDAEDFWLAARFSAQIRVAINHFFNYLIGVLRKTGA